MTQKLFYLCATCALLFAFATVNVASAQDIDPVAVAGCPCATPCKPACSYDPCCPPVSYRVGLFGVVRPVVYAPVYRPVYFPARFVAPAYVPYRPACPPYYCW